MSDQCEVNESTSLSRMVAVNSNSNHNNNNNNNNYNSTSVETGDERISNNMEMDKTRAILVKIVIDVVILLCVGLPILFLYLWGEPYKRGFFCDDESLMHPFHDSTVKNWLLYIIGLILPIGVIIATEIIQSKINKTHITKKIRIFDVDIPRWVVTSYNQVGIFGFGAAASQLTTDIAKYTIGRLRPHFFSVCQPVMPDGTNCSNPINIGKYIVDFTCGAYGSDARMLKEMRLSFPSGHASFAAYTMIYLGIYLHMRMTWRGSKLFKNFIQFLLFVLAWYTALSRISNYKHHWSDVLGGATIGIFTALIVSNFVSDLFKKSSNSTLPTRYEMSSPTNGV